MRKPLLLVALSALALAGPAIAQGGMTARSFCDGLLEVQASARGASDAQGNFVQYYAFIAMHGDALSNRAAIISFAPPAPVQASAPQRVSLREGRQQVILGQERRPGGMVSPSIPRGQIGNHVTVQCQ